MTTEMTAFLAALVAAVQSPVVTIMIAVFTAGIVVKISFWGVNWLYRYAVRLFAKRG